MMQDCWGNMPHHLELVYTHFDPSLDREQTPHSRHLQPTSPLPRHGTGFASYLVNWLTGMELVL